MRKRVWVLFRDDTKSMFPLVLRSKRSWQRHYAPLKGTGHITFIQESTDKNYLQQLAKLGNQET